MEYEDIKKYWVLEHGKDCDGSYTSGRISGFSTYMEAHECLESSFEWSDGLQYQLTDSMDELKEYCYEHQLNVEDYL